VKVLPYWSFSEDGDQDQVRIPGRRHDKTTRNQDCGFVNGRH